jgi:hypothetical protein
MTPPAGRNLCATTLFGHLNLFTASQFALDVVEFSTTEPRRAIYLGMPCANLPMRAPRRSLDNLTLVRGQQMG